MDKSYSNQAPFSTLCGQRKVILTLRSSLCCDARGRLVAFRFAHPDITATI